MFQLKIKKLGDSYLDNIQIIWNKQFAFEIFANFFGYE